jgi:hypothetical protein
MPVRIRASQMSLRSAFIASYLRQPESGVVPAIR